MIETTLKYFIADFCINTFFEQVFTNFNRNEQKTIPEIGDYFKKIVHVDFDEVYYDCIVIDKKPIINASGQLNGEYLLFIQFSQSRVDGEIDTVDDSQMYDFDNINDEDVGDMEDMGDEDDIEVIDPSDIDDGEVDLSDSDLFETDDEHIIGINTEFYKFYT